MNIYKKAKLRNLTNEELINLLQESNWYDGELLRELYERRKDGRVKKLNSYLEYLHLHNINT